MLGGVFAAGGGIPGLGVCVRTHLGHCHLCPTWSPGLVTGLSSLSEDV